jgi:hypothetical protein
MLARATLRTGNQLAAATARRGFHATRAQLSSPYHYPEGPLSNLPFNPRKRGPGFAIGYWTFCVTGFGLPFAIACTFLCLPAYCLSRRGEKGGGAGRGWKPRRSCLLLTVIEKIDWQMHHPAKA